VKGAVVRWSPPAHGAHWKKGAGGSGAIDSLGVLRLRASHFAQDDTVVGASLRLEAGEFLDAGLYDFDVGVDLVGGEVAGAEGVDQLLVR
jgi:hypothetical protein